jgi:hypothetical protein
MNEQSSFEAIASFFKVDTTYLTYACSGIVINGHSLTERPSGSKIYFNMGDSSFFNFGSGTNRIIILNSPPNIPSVDTSLAFPSPLRITSLSRGDTISNNSSLTLLWSGAPSGTEYASLNIFKQTNLDDTSSAIIEGSAILVNDGDFTISSTVMNEFTAGYYDITLTGFHPQFITLSNGKKIAVIYKDKHSITVYIH